MVRAPVFGSGRSRFKHFHFTVGKEIRIESDYRSPIRIIIMGERRADALLHYSVVYRYGLE